MFNGKTLKLNIFIMRSTNNLMETDWMQKFKLYDMLINSFCKKLKVLLMRQTY